MGVAALGHSDDMQQRNFFSHRGSNGSNPGGSTYIGGLQLAYLRGEHCCGAVVGAKRGQQLDEQPGTLLQRYERQLP